MVKRVVLDPHQELVDANYGNNSIYGPITFDKIELTTQPKNPLNPMQLKKEAEKLKEKEGGEVAEPSGPK